MAEAGFIYDYVPSVKRIDSAFIGMLCCDSTVLLIFGVRASRKGLFPPQERSEELVFL
jgi:hypothetical protein